MQAVDFRAGQNFGDAQCAFVQILIQSRNVEIVVYGVSALIFKCLHIVNVALVYITHLSYLGSAVRSEYILNDSSCANLKIHNLSWIHPVVRIQRSLDRSHDLESIPVFIPKVFYFPRADTVLARACAGHP